MQQRSRCVRPHFIDLSFWKENEPATETPCLTMRWKGDGCDASARSRDRTAAEPARPLGISLAEHRGSREIEPSFYSKRGPCLSPRGGRLFSRPGSSRSTSHLARHVAGARGCIFVHHTLELENELLTSGATRNFGVPTIFTMSPLLPRIQTLMLESHLDIRPNHLPRCSLQCRRSQ